MTKGRFCLMATFASDAIVVLMSQLGKKNTLEKKELKKGLKNIIIYCNLEQIRLLERSRLADALNVAYRLHQSILTRDA